MPEPNMLSEGRNAIKLTEEAVAASGAGVLSF
jgi:hypothetical protein